MYSALKKNGQPLYKLARKGEIIERPARDMTVYSLNAERLDDVHVKLSVHCSSGFYIRSLGHDLGQVLGCGAHVVELRRTDIKALNVGVAHSLDHILQAPLESLIQPTYTVLVKLVILALLKPRRPLLTLITELLLNFLSLLIAYC